VLVADKIRLLENCAERASFLCYRPVLWIFYVVRGVGLRSLLWQYQSGGYCCTDSFVREGVAIVGFGRWGKYKAWVREIK